MEVFFSSVLIKLVFCLPSIIIALTVHEFFHAFTAFRFGDPTAKYENRISLNPLAHIDPIGGGILIISFLFFNFPFGWAKPVPVNEYYLKNPKNDLLWVSFAGPLSNITMAAVAGLLLKFNIISVNDYAGLFVSFFIKINLGLGLFNMLPVPPLDGWKILQGLLPTEMANSLRNLERRNQYLLMAILLVVIFSGIVDILVGLPYRYLYTIFTS